MKNFNENIETYLFQNDTNWTGNDTFANTTNDTSCD